MMDGCLHTEYQVLAVNELMRHYLEAMLYLQISIKYLGMEKDAEVPSMDEWITGNMLRAFKCLDEYSQVSGIPSGAVLDMYEELDTEIAKVAEKLLFRLFDIEEIDDGIFSYADSIEEIAVSVDIEPEYLEREYSDLVGVGFDSYDYVFDRKDIFITADEKVSGLIATKDKGVLSENERILLGLYDRRDHMFRTNMGIDFAYNSDGTKEYAVLVTGYNADGDAVTYSEVDFEYLYLYAKYYSLVFLQQ